LALHDRLTALAGETSMRCPTQRLLDTLQPDDAGVLADLLADPAVPTFRLFQALRAEGYRISRDTISAHRSGRCYCGATEQIQ